MLVRKRNMVQWRAPPAVRRTASPEARARAPIVALETFAVDKPFAFHSDSRDSTNADDRKRNKTGDRLSPFLTPIIWDISFFSVPILVSTIRFWYIC